MQTDVIPVPLRDNTGQTIAFAVIDADLAHLAEQSWHLHGDQDGRPGHKLYARHSRGGMLHHAVLGGKPPAGMVVDHINGLCLDNRRANLRVILAGGNQQNLEAARRGAAKMSRHRGVTRDRRRQAKPWLARVTVAGTVHSLGYFATEDEAGEAAARFRAQRMPYSREASGRGQ